MAAFELITGVDEYSPGTVGIFISKDGGWSRIATAHTHQRDLNPDAEIPDGLRLVKTHLEYWDWSSARGAFFPNSGRVRIDLTWTGSPGTAGVRSRSHQYARVRTSPDPGVRAVTVSPLACIERYHLTTIPTQGHPAALAATILREVNLVAPATPTRTAEHWITTQHWRYDKDTGSRSQEFDVERVGGPTQCFSPEALARLGSELGTVEEESYYHHMRRY